MKILEHTDRGVKIGNQYFTKEGAAEIAAEVHLINNK
jgi:hypothetical protein